MRRKMKKPLAILLIIALVVGCYAFIAGIKGDALYKKIPLGLDIKGGVYVVMEAETDLTGAKLTELMNQTKTVLEHRVDQMGIANADVRVEGKKRIRVELPGAENAEEAISQIGKTAQLQFTMADGSKVLDGGQVKNASISQDQKKAGYVVNLEFKSKGAKAFEDATKKAMQGGVTPKIIDDYGNKVESDSIVIFLDDEVISAPKVQQVISGGKCEISGNFTEDGAKQLAALIRGGSLPAPLKEVTSSSQSAEIGYHAFEKSVKAGFIGIILVFILMFIGYQMMGLIADIALAMYVLIILLIMGYVGVVLTLPGIAGLILSIGMAVDANVVIFTRIKEEIMDGKSARVAVQTGFKRAMSTVIDSQVTTLIAAVILYQIGTSAVKGFAWTLMVGILVGLLTAVVITQLYLHILSETKAFSDKKFYGIRADGTATFAIKKQFKFIENRKKYFIVVACILVIGLGASLIRGFNYGIDFTGGTMLQVDMHEQVEVEKVQDTIKKYDLDPTIIYGGADNQEIIIKTQKALDNQERAEVLGDMQDEFKFKDKDILAQNLFGPSVGKELKSNAIKAVLLAALGMLIYIRLRFREWKFGAAAILGLLNDVLFVTIFYGIFSIQINNPFIAALLTVVGYSINDTIVIFDRIRENTRFLRGDRIENIDLSINQTLSRSVMTSVTTLVVMVPLFIMGGPAIREFVLPLMVGVFVGCISSIFICSPLYYEMETMKGGSKYERKIKEAEKQRKQLGIDTEQQADLDRKKSKKQPRSKRKKKHGR